MDLRFRRLEPGCYSIEVDDEEVGAVLQYVEPGVRHWDILWDNHPDDEGDNWRRQRTGCHTLAKAKLFATLFVGHIVARDWMPVRNGADPQQLAEAMRQASGERRQLN